MTCFSRPASTTAAPSAALAALTSLPIKSILPPPFFRPAGTTLGFLHSDPLGRGPVARLCERASRFEFCSVTSRSPFVALRESLLCVVRQSPVRLELLPRQVQVLRRKKDSMKDSLFSSKKEDMDVTAAEIDLYFGWHEKVLHNGGG